MSWRLRRHESGLEECGDLVKKNKKIAKKWTFLLPLGWELKKVKIISGPFASTTDLYSQTKEIQNEGLAQFCGNLIDCHGGDNIEIKEIGGERFYFFKDIITE